MSRFTAREREVLRLMAQGLGAREIAQRLGISADTARKHRDNAVRRSGTGSQVATILQLERGDPTATA